MAKWEEFLLYRMTIKRWLVAVCLVAVVSFFAGREYLKWEMRSALQTAVSDFTSKMDANIEESKARLEKSQEQFKARMQEAAARRNSTAR